MKKCSIEQQGFINTLNDKRENWESYYLLKVDLDMTKLVQGKSVFETWKELLPKTLNRFDVGYKVFQNNPIRLADNVKPAKELIIEEKKLKTLLVIYLHLLNYQTQKQKKL